MSVGTTGRAVPWDRVDDFLSLATASAPVADAPPRPPRSLFGRLVKGSIGRAVRRLSRPITSRQAQYNVAVLQAIGGLASRVRALGEPAEGEIRPRDDTPKKFALLGDAPVHMSWAERVALYGTVFSSRPRRALEIGTLFGGSAMITVAAMDDAGVGQVVCVDPNPRVAPETWRRIEHRAQILTGPSPDCLTEAQRLAGGPFDLAMIDGDHSYDGVIRDVRGTLPVLADPAYLLFHDAYFHEVRQGLIDLFAEFSGRLVDCGMLATPPNPDAENPGVVWGGMRLARYSPSGVY